MRFVSPIAVLVAVASGAAFVPPAAAQPMDAGRPDPNVVPFEVRDVGVEEQLGEQVPANLLFRDHTGNRVRLGDYFDGTRPVILTLNYSRCPKICDAQLRNLALTLGELDLTAGEDYRVVTVSIDPSEGPDVSASRRRGYVGEMGKGNWSFLTGLPESIARLARAVGFNYNYDAATREFHHSPVAVLLTPTGRVGRYLHGITFEPDTVRLSLVETGEGTLGTTSDYFPLICYRYDPERGTYVTRKAELLMAGTGFAFVLLFGGWLSYQWRHARGTPAGSDPSSGSVRREDARNGEPAAAPATV